jgi:hypothetical protein
VGCSSSTTDLGPPDQRTYPYSFEKVWQAAQDAVPRAWGMPVRTSDTDRGILTFEPRLVTISASSAAWERYGKSAPTGQVRQDLTVFVRRGGGDLTDVTVRIESDRPDASVNPEEENNHLSRQILEAIDKQLKK